MDDRENPLEPMRLLWFGLIALTIFGLGVVVLKPPRGPEEEKPTPAPSPEIASLQCLDGKTFRSVDEIAAQQHDDGVPTKGFWTITFGGGGYVVNHVGVQEAGRYRCNGGTVIASSALGSHHGQYDAPGGRLAWDGQGYELVTPGAGTPEPTPETPEPGTVSTSGGP